jgi:hypothetical protein
LCGATGPKRRKAYLGGAVPTQPALRQDSAPAAGQVARFGVGAQAGHGPDPEEGAEGERREGVAPVQGLLARPFKAE